MPGSGRFSGRAGRAGRLVGHSGTSMTGTVHLHVIRPALTKGATAMNRILKAKTAKLT